MADNVRVQKFSPTGEFLLKFGENNLKLHGIDPITVGPGGSIYVGDSGDAITPK